MAGTGKVRADFRALEIERNAQVTVCNGMTQTEHLIAAMRITAGELPPGQLQETLRTIAARAARYADNIEAQELAERILDAMAKPRYQP